MNIDEIEAHRAQYEADIASGKREPVAFGHGQGVAPSFYEYHDGDKFPGGFGPTKLFTADYWTLRKRSEQLFTENLYSRGLIRRLITNEINTGIALEATPDDLVLGVSEDKLNDWSELVENRFIIWGKDKALCDHKGEQSFGALQRTARREALICGDVLVVLRQPSANRPPMVQLVSGGKVRTPIDQGTKLAKGHVIRHGVELDAAGRVVAYWVQQDDGEPAKRLPARTARGGRTQAWLVYGSDKRLDDVRGEPLLSIMLQSLKEIDRYRDSTQRKAVVNSIVAMFIKKTEDKPGTRPLTGGAIRRGAIHTEDESGPRQFNIASQLPGLAIEELQQGEEPVLLGGQGTDTNFSTFEAAVINAIAWANELPPEILTLAFSNNYSASQAAINEFKIYLNKFWAEWGESFCQPIYVEWLLSEVLRGRISARGLLDAWRDPAQRDQFGAWVLSDWYGSIKPSTDMLKQAKGSELLVAQGWSSNARESRMLTGTKFTKNIKKLKRENELKIEAMRPMAEFQQEYGQIAEEPAPVAFDAADVEAMIEEYLAE